MNPTIAELHGVPQLFGRYCCKLFSPVGWAPGICLILLALFDSVTAQAANLQVTLVNGLSREQLPYSQLLVFEVMPAGNLEWRRIANTDASGKAVMDLPGLGAGRTYRFLSEPYGLPVWSRDVQTGGNFEFSVGRLRVALVRGLDGSPLANTFVGLGVPTENGVINWLSAGMTDATGLAHLDPPENEGVVVLVAASPSDGRWIVSHEMAVPGIHEFLVGNEALSVELVDGVSNLPMAGVELQAYEVIAGGGLEGHAVYTTDASGEALMDLPGLGAGRTYRILAQAYGEPVWSSDLQAAGHFQFKVGRLQVSVVRGFDGEPMASTDIGLGVPEAGGVVRWLSSSNTDTLGMVRMDPPENEDTIVLAAQSPIDGRWVLSEPLAVPGSHLFVVGNQVLTVELVDGIRNEVLADEDVVVYEVMPGGKLEWRAEFTTDESGTTTMDLPGLGQGQTYRLLAEPFGLPIWSGDLQTSGHFEFQISRLEDLVAGGRRPFYMGFTPWPWDTRKAALDDTYAFINQNSDIISHHLEEGIPWTEALQDSTFPPALMAEWGARRSQTAADKQVFLSVNPLDLAREGLAAYRGSSALMDLPEAFQNKAFDDPDVEQAFLNFSRRAVDYFAPDYLAIAVEVNELLERSPGKWPAFAELYKSTYQSLKLQYPDLQIFFTVSAHNVLNTVAGEREILWQEIEKLWAYSDLVGISLYPFLQHEFHPSNPVQALNEAIARANKPVAVTEAGFPAKQSIVTEFSQLPSGVDLQNDVYSLILEQAYSNQFEFVILWTHRDYEPLWQRNKNSISPWAALWMNTGLLDSLGNPRESFATWDLFFQLPSEASP